jgi:hypothetical protein
MRSSEVARIKQMNRDAPEPRATATTGSVYSS